MYLGLARCDFAGSHSGVLAPKNSWLEMASTKQTEMVNSPSELPHVNRSTVEAAYCPDGCLTRCATYASGRPCGSELMKQSPAELQSASTSDDVASQGNSYLLADLHVAETCFTSCI